MSTARTSFILLIPTCNCGLSTLALAVRRQPLVPGVCSGPARDDEGASGSRGVGCSGLQEPDTSAGGARPQRLPLRKGDRNRFACLCFRGFVGQLWYHSFDANMSGWSAVGGWTCASQLGRYDGNRGRLVSVLQKTERSSVHTVVHSHESAFLVLPKEKTVYQFMVKNPASK